MDAIQILDIAIAKVSAMQNAQDCDASGMIKRSQEVKSIARKALVDVNASQSMLNALEQISFESGYTGHFADKMYGIEGMFIGIQQTYQTGVKMVIQLLTQERDARTKKKENDRSDKALLVSILALIVAVLSLLVALFK